MRRAAVYAASGGLLTLAFGALAAGGLIAGGVTDAVWDAVAGEEKEGE